MKAQRLQSLLNLLFFCETSIPLLGLQFQPGQVAMKADPRILQTETAQKIFGGVDFLQCGHIDRSSGGDARGEAGALRFGCHLQIQMGRYFADILLAELKRHIRRHNFRSAQRLKPWAVAFQIGDVCAVQNMRGAARRRKLAEPLVQFLLAKKTAVVGVRAIVRIVIFMSLNEVVLHIVLAAKFLNEEAILRRDGGRIAGHRHRIFPPQRAARHHGQQCRIDTAGKPNNHSSQRADKIFQTKESFHKIVDTFCNLPNLARRLQGERVKGGSMRTHFLRWQSLLAEGKSLAQLSDYLSRQLRPDSSRNFSGGTEWEYDERVWYRNVLPSLGDGGGAALQNRLHHFVVEVRAFLRDMRALKKTASGCPQEHRAGQILYDAREISQGWDLAWRYFIRDYEKIRQAFSKADLECEGSECGEVDEISLPFLPELNPYWSMAACELTTRPIFDDGSQ